MAKSLGIADVDTMLAGAAVNPKVAKGITRQVLEGAVSEGLLEELPQSVMEQVLQNIALDRPWTIKSRRRPCWARCRAPQWAAERTSLAPCASPPSREEAGRHHRCARRGHGHRRLPEVGEDARDAGRRGRGRSWHAAARMEKSLTGTDPAALLGVPSLGGGHQCLDDHRRALQPGGPPRR